MNENKPYDVVAIGNAIVDVLSFADDAFIKDNGVDKGTMMLIDEARAKSLYEKMGSCTEISGGSAANTLAGMASLGSKTAFIGKVFDDELGRIFRHDLRATGVDFDTIAASKGRATARCLILVAPDGERTMNTFIGACNEIYDADIDADLIAKAKVIYGEGYMWDLACTKRAIEKSFADAKASGAKIAFTLSDVFCVSRAREEFVAMLENDLDILFCNEAEIQALYPDMSMGDILDHVQGKAEIIVVTKSEKGSTILTKDDRISVDAAPINELVDTTGAGDLYAAGFLHGYCAGKPLAECGRLGAICAGEIIQHLGARAQKPLSKLVA
jgi:sugar/nucleoside kinase (ribokinase family)